MANVPITTTDPLLTVLPDGDNADAEPHEVIDTEGSGLPLIEETCVYSFSELEDRSIRDSPTIPEVIEFTRCNNGNLNEYAAGLADIRPNIIYNLILSLIMTLKMDYEYQTFVDLYYGVSQWGQNVNFTSVTNLFKSTIVNHQTTAITAEHLIMRRRKNDFVVVGKPVTIDQMTRLVLSFFESKGLNGRVLMQTISYLGYSFKEYLKFNSYSNQLVVTGSNLDMIRAQMYFIGTSVLSRIKISPSVCMRLFEFGSIWKPLCGGPALTQVNNALATGTTKLIDIYQRQIRVLNAIAVMTDILSLKLAVRYVQDKAGGSSDTKVWTEAFNDLRYAVSTTTEILFNKAAAIEEPISVYYLAAEDIYLTWLNMEDLDERSIRRIHSLKNTGLTFDRISVESSVKYGMKPGDRRYRFINDLPPKKGTRETVKRTYIDKSKYREIEVSNEQIAEHFNKRKKVKVELENIVGEMEHYTKCVNMDEVTFNPESSRFEPTRDYKPYVKEAEEDDASALKEFIKKFKAANK